MKKERKRQAINDISNVLYTLLGTVDAISDKIYLTQEQRNRLRLAIRNEVERVSDGQNLITEQTAYPQLKNGKLPIPHVSGSTDKKEECKHEYRTFVDRVDKSQSMFCWKCGKDYEGVYSKRM